MKISSRAAGSQGEAAVSAATQGMPGAQRSVVFCVHAWVQVRPRRSIARFSFFVHLAGICTHVLHAF